MNKDKGVSAAREMQASLDALKERFNGMVGDFEGSFRANGVGPAGAQENADLYDRIAEDILSYLPDPKLSRVALEIGCGTGEIMRRVRPHVQSIRGVDVSDRMVEVCRAAGLEANLVGHTLPFADASFDLVILYSVLINIDDPVLFDLMMEEAFRITKGDGVIFLGSVPNANELNFLVHQVPGKLQQFKRIVKGLLGREIERRNIRYFAYYPEQFVGYCSKFQIQRFVLKPSLLSESGMKKIDVVYRLDQTALPTA